MLRRIAAEAFGTFCLVFAGTGAIVVDDVSGGAITHVGIALVFGLVVMAMIHAVGDVSGAHLNPAVTFGMWSAGRLPAATALTYVAGQAVGAFAASGLLRLLFPWHASLGATVPAGTDWQSFVLEAVLTFILMVVVLRVSSGPQERGMLAGITVGAVIGLEAMFAGPISGASMNPMRSLAPAVVGGTLTGLWVYLTAPLVGALVGVAAHRVLRDDA
jgi:aquaporin Z